MMLEKKYKDIFQPRYRIVTKKMSMRKKMLLRIGFFFPEIADLLERKKNGWTK